MNEIPLCHRLRAFLGEGGTATRSAKKQTDRPFVLMKKYVLCVSLIIAGIAIPGLQAFWVRMEISSDCHHDANTMCDRSVSHERAEYGIPSFVSITKDRLGTEAFVHQENLLIYIATSIVFSFLAGRLWPRVGNTCDQRAAPSDGDKLAK